MFVGCLHCEVILSSLSVLPGLGGSLCTQPAPREWRVTEGVKTVNQILSLLWIEPLSCPWTKPTTRRLLCHSPLPVAPHSPATPASRSLPQRCPLCPRPWACARLSPRPPLPHSPPLTGFFSFRSLPAHMSFSSEPSRTNPGEDPEPREGSPKPFLSRGRVLPHALRPAAETNRNRGADAWELDGTDP